MSGAPSHFLEARLARLRARLTEANLPALLVTHLPHVRYLTNLTASAAAMVVTSRTTHLVTDFRYAGTAERLLAGEASLPDCQLTVVRSTYDEELASLLQALGCERVGVESAHLPLARFRWFEARLGTAPTLVPAEPLIERLRIVKDAHEIGTLRQAATLISKVAHELPGQVRQGLAERQVAAWIDSALKIAGFDECAFVTIVASGPNGARPHARAGDRRLEPSDLVVLDFGGVYDGYCVDLTRTLAVGSPPAEARLVHAAVRNAQAAAIDAVRPGVRASDVDRAARDVLSRAGLGEAFGHSTGHGLGLEVHEEPRIATPKEGREHEDIVLEPGMVFTIEPGAYLPAWGGVRIEDDVLVTAGGCDVLTSVPRDL